MSRLSLGILRQAVLRPAGLSLLAACLVAWPIWSVASPIALTTSTLASWHQLYAIVLLSSLSGALLACAALQHLRTTLRVLSGPQVFAVQLACVAGASALFVLAGAAFPLWAGAATGDVAPASASLRLALTVAHLTALCLVALSFTRSTQTCILSILGFGWFLPALWVPAGQVGRAVIDALDAARYLRSESQPPHIPGSLLADMAPTAALILTAMLLRAGARRSS